MNQTVVFLHVQDNASKLEKIVSTISGHYARGSSVLITTPTLEVALYIDSLLWRMPPTSFLPHTISDFTTSERIAITTSETNVNQAKVLINLRPEVSRLSGSIPHVYELYDSTHPQKEELSKKRQAAYQTNGKKWILE